MHSQLSDEDYRILGSSAARQRQKAIEAGTAWSVNGWDNHPIVARTRVTAEPGRQAPRPKPATISADDFDRLTIDDKMTRSRLEERGAAWSPKGSYGDEAFVRRVSLAAK